MAGATARAETTSSSWADAPIPLSPNQVEEPKKGLAEAEEKHGVSILKEIFPNHGEPTQKTAPPRLAQLLSSVPSPARNMPSGGNSIGNSYFASPHNRTPCGPPAHAPSIPLVAPVVPPPPPTVPAPSQQQFALEPAGGSYRERLRAGGRGAFQRAFDAGYMPKNIKQEWGASAPFQAPDYQNGAAMAYGDANQMWSGMGQMQRNDYCGVPMQSQYPQTPEMQQAMAAQMTGQQMVAPVPVQQSQMQVQQMLPQMAVQQPMQMMSMGQGEQSPQQLAQQMQQLPPLAMSQVQMQTPTSSGQSTPTSIDSVRSECMAILGLGMPASSQFPCVDQNAVLAEQLRASADCQRYED